MIRKTSRNIQHGLALSYKVRKVSISGVIDLPSVLKVLPILLEIEE